MPGQRRRQRRHGLTRQHSSRDNTAQSRQRGTQTIHHGRGKDHVTVRQLPAKRIGKFIQQGRADNTARPPDLGNTGHVQ